MLARLFGQWAVPTAEPGTVLCLGLHLQDMAAWPDCCRPFTTVCEQRAARRFAQVADAARHLAGRALARRMRADQRFCAGLRDLYAGLLQLKMHKPRTTALFGEQIIPDLSVASEARDATERRHALGISFFAMLDQSEPSIALNLATAKAIGFDFPFDVLVTADELHETISQPHPGTP